MRPMMTKDDTIKMIHRLTWILKGNVQTHASLVIYGVNQRAWHANVKTTPPLFEIHVGDMKYKTALKVCDNYPMHLSKQMTADDRSLGLLDVGICQEREGC
jgi:hypothetical protein